MGETEEHLVLVRRTVEYVRWRLRSHTAVAIFADLPSASRAGKPPRVGGFVPDVFASDVPRTIDVIGEAKTEGDLEQPHTIVQLTAFLEHLRLLGGILVLAVPWQARAGARRLLRTLVESQSAQSVETVVIDEVSQWP